MGEMGTIMAEAAQMVNSRPIARSTGDPETGGPITPLHLLLGRASVEVPQVLVGSSMGGWLALLLARAVPGRVKGLVGIAAAPDFTEDSMWAQATAAQRSALLRDGFIQRPGAYGDDPYVITRRLIEDGRAHLVLRAPLALPFPVRLLHGTADGDVPSAVALRLLGHATGPDMRLTLVKDADHRFSSPDCLALIETAVSEVS